MSNYLIYFFLFALALVFCLAIVEFFDKNNPKGNKK
jgi:hypothetical protein